MMPARIATAAAGAAAVASRAHATIRNRQGGSPAAFPAAAMAASAFGGRRAFPTAPRARWLACRPADVAFRPMVRVVNESHHTDSGSLLTPLS